MATEILVNHVFVEDGKHAELTCVRCGRPKSAMRLVHFQIDPSRSAIDQLRSGFESACTGLGSAEFENMVPSR